MVYKSIISMEITTVGDHFFDIVFFMGDINKTVLQRYQLGIVINRIKLFLQTHVNLKLKFFCAISHVSVYARITGKLFLT